MSSPRPRSLDDVRLDLLGVGKPSHQRTEQQRALTRILLCRPRRFLFDPDRPDVEQLERSQLRYKDLQADFFLAKSVDELLAIARELATLEGVLSRASYANALAGRAPGTTAPLAD